MASNTPIFRPSELPFEKEQNKHVRRVIIDRARELLKQPPPDTFVGRKTQEPFPIAPKSVQPLDPLVEAFREPPAQRSASRGYALGGTGRARTDARRDSERNSVGDVRSDGRRN